MRKEITYKDIIKLVEDLKKYPRSVKSDDKLESDPPYFSLVSDDNVRFIISLEDFQKSVDTKAPNNHSVVIFTNYAKSSAGKETFLKIVNKDKPEFDNKVEFNDNSTKEKVNNEEISVEDSFNDVEITVSNILDNCVKDFLFTTATVESNLIEDWLKKSIYAKLLIDVINGDGAKGLWLQMVLEKIEENNKK